MTLLLRLPVVVLVALGVTAGLGGCPLDDPEDDDTPPRFLTMEPLGNVLPVTTTFRATFSEELNDKTVAADLTSEELLTVLLIERGNGVETEEDIELLLGDMDNPPLSQSRIDLAVDILVAVVEDDTTLVITPRANLKPGTTYSLILDGDLRDTAGNPLVGSNGLKSSVIRTFSTDAGAPQIDGGDIEADDVVVPNRKRFTVTFNQPVQNVTTSSLRIVPESGEAAPVVEAVLMNEERDAATIILGSLDGGCERLEPNGSYAVVATPDIVADTGQALLDFRASFTVSGACDATANVASNLEIVASDVVADVRFTTTKPSTTEVRFGVLGGALDCLGQACPVLGAPTSAANAVHNVALSGLAVDVDYEIVAFAEDEVGNVARIEGTFRTAVLPKVAVNEVLANAEGSSDPAGIFIELQSFEPNGTAPLDLAGWTLRIVRVSPDVGQNPIADECVLPVDVPPLAAGDIIAFGDDSFDVALYNNVDEDKLFKFADMCSLIDDPVIVELVDPAARPVSAMTLPAAADGESVERRDAAGPDTEDNVCRSRDDTGPTPTRTNGVTERGCE